MSSPADRAKARAQRMIVRKVRPGAPDVDLTPVSGDEAIALVHQLTRTSYALAGLPWPTYPRSNIPVKFVPWRSR
jgi:hypothetical protein